MTNAIENNPWMWVIVEDRPGNEHYIGQQDEKTGVSFIPAFQSKEDALKGFHGIKQEKGGKNEVQAVRLKVLAKDCLDHGFMIFVLDSEGRILERIDPASPRTPLQ